MVIACTLSNDGAAARKPAAITVALDGKQQQAGDAAYLHGSLSFGPGPIDVVASLHEKCRGGR
jgi:hypothetical protein